MVCLPKLVRLHVLVAIVAVLAGAPLLVDAESSGNDETTLVSGDLETWDRIFASRSPQVLLDGPANNLIWTEGPVSVGNELIFSDTIGAQMYSLDLRSVLENDVADENSNEGGPSKYLRVIKERSGDSLPEEDSWRAEPGSNGLAVLTEVDGDDKSSKVLVCQHGARRLAIVDVNTGETTPLATDYGDKRLNGPNDVAVHTEEVEGVKGEQKAVRTYAYFTDPVYAWLEKGRFEDLPYLDDNVRKEGPGHCGVYRTEIYIEGNSSKKGHVELITAEMARPNGIGFDGEDLIVSDCCQGSHLDGCISGISRWQIYRQRVGGSSDGSTSWVHSATIEDVESAENSVGGCADGFSLYNFDDDSSTYGRRKRRNKHVLLASCYGGLCVVDLEVGEVVARIWTAKIEKGGCKISNAAIGNDRVYLTGSCGILILPLRHHGQSGSSSPDNDQDQGSIHGEL